MTYQYHDALDEQEVLCACLEYIGDNGDCPVHGNPFTNPLEGQPHE